MAKLLLAAIILVVGSIAGATFIGNLRHGTPAVVSVAPLPPAPTAAHRTVRSPDAKATRAASDGGGSSPTMPGWLVLPVIVICIVSGAGVVASLRPKARGTETPTAPAGDFWHVIVDARIAGQWSEASRNYANIPAGTRASVATQAIRQAKAIRPGEYRAKVAPATAEAYWAAYGQKAS